MANSDSFQKPQSKGQNKATKQVKLQGFSESFFLCMSKATQPRSTDINFCRLRSFKCQKVANLARSSSLRKLWPCSAPLQLKIIAILDKFLSDQKRFFSCNFLSHVNILCSFRLKLFICLDKV